MKKSITILTISVMLFALSIIFTSCSKCEHTYFSDCDKTCNECGEVRETTAEHYYYGDCDGGCHSCFEDREVVAEHSWIPATCTTGEACEGCGALKGEALGHTWVDADCDTPKTCSVCEITEGNALGHTPAEDDGDCTTEVECTACGEITTPARTEHTQSEDDEDCSTAVTCEHCDHIFVEAKSHDFATGEAWSCTHTAHWYSCLNEGCYAKDNYSEHIPEEDDGDCTTHLLCDECGWVLVEGNDSHSYGYVNNGDGTHTYGCSACSVKTIEEHTFDQSCVCVCGTVVIDATEMTNEQLNTAMAEKLASGITDIIVILSPDADDDASSSDTDTMQYAIRSALNSSDVADGSVNLTIKGLKAVASGFLGTYDYYNEETGHYVEEAAVTKIRSITFMDATEIGWGAFENCTSLVSVFAPNVSYIAIYAFAGCTSLETVSLTSEGDIALGEINMAKIVFGAPSVSEQVKLILHANKQADVVENAFAGYTFGAVMYVCADITNAHSLGETVAYFWNEDFTVCYAGYPCTKCSYIDVVETVSATLEAVTENSTAHSAVFTNEEFEAQTKTFGYIYDSETNTYSVWNEDGLNIWRLAVAKDYATNLTLMDDITLSTEGITVDENGKPSASNWTWVYRFEGTLDGNGHSIVNLRIYDANEACFIGVAWSATIKNLTLENPVVYGEDPYTASLVSQLHLGSSLINCHVQGGSVTGEMSGVGGLVGTVSYGESYIYGCTNSAKVTGTRWVGGIIGTGGSNISDINVVIVACANFGEVSGTEEVGGIAGNLEIYDELIACYTTGGNLCGDTDGTATVCYYVADSETDTMEGTTAVTNVNTADVVNAMNAAIDTYNSSATVKVTYKWAVGAGGVPVLVEAE